MASHKGCCQDRNPQASLDTSPESQTPKACLPGSTSITEAHSQQSAWLPRGLRGPWLRAANAVDNPDLTGCTHGPGARLFLPRAQGRLAASGLFPFYTQKLHVCACVCRCLPVCAQGRPGVVLLQSRPAPTTGAAMCLRPSQPECGAFWAALTSSGRAGTQPGPGDSALDCDLQRGKEVPLLRLLTWPARK